MELKKEQKVLMEIMRAAIHGEPYTAGLEGISLGELHHLAAIHHVSALIYDQIGKELQCDPEYEALSAAWRQEAMHQVFAQVQMTGNFLNVYRALCGAGVIPLVVKGLVCRNLYPKPDYRISGDEDLLIRKEDFAACDALLREKGFRREELEPNQELQEVSYLHQRTGVYLEVHLSLFPEESGAYGHLNREFEDVFNRAVMTPDKLVRTMDPTDHYFYLICHSFKHFLHSGFGIRQVCDIGMFQARYGSEIRYEEVFERLERLHMKVFWANLEAIIRDGLGLDLSEAGVPACREIDDADPDSLLQDLLNGGVYGDSSMERKHSSNITLQAAAAGKKATGSSILASLFPDMGYMKQRYPWLRNMPFLLPVAWIARIGIYGRDQMGRKSGEDNSIEIGMDRVELLRKYGVIK